ncbi:Hypothetical Protein FCC1311_090432 [Hondaea fermentalgiana]|uniref:Uncharacterized protein n=1 Tax=Hondaea fermentalgiana TaxID=2315210 RepID=A0A2R5GST0_9STRA|nr:Hypothetical Protein FCC1311_090432 [Hondaea fermentalgiana]|eukprot:GBG32818.1 Hypothetical Protein FCC1311_090432 [Hondaea fermentalgiana]
MAFLMSKRVGAGDVQALQFLDPGAEVLAVVVDDELKVFQLGFRAWFGAIAGHVASPLAQSPVLWQLRTRVELGKLVDKPQLVALATGREAVSGEGKFWIATAFSSGEIARFEYDHSLSARELASHKPQIQLASINIPLASCTFCPQGRHVLVLTLEEGRAAYVNLGEEQREEDSEPQAQHVGLGLHWLAAQWIKPGETALLVRRDGMRKLVSVPSGAERVSYQALCANAKAQWLLPLRLETADAGFWIMGGFTPPGVQGSRDEPQETKLYGFRRFDRPAKSGASAEAEFAVLVLTEVGISFTEQSSIGCQA